MIAAVLLAVYLLFFNVGHDQLGTLTEYYVKDRMKVVIVDEGRRKLALQGLSVVNDDISDLNKQVSIGAEHLEKLI
jgi:septum formation topological specificity factor MinE